MRYLQLETAVHPIYDSGEQRWCSRLAVPMYSGSNPLPDRALLPVVFDQSPAHITISVAFGDVMKRLSLTEFHSIIQRVSEITHGCFDAPTRNPHLLLVSVSGETVFVGHRLFDQHSLPEMLSFSLSSLCIFLDEDTLLASSVISTSEDETGLKNDLLAASKRVRQVILNLIK